MSGSYTNCAFISAAGHVKNQGRIRKKRRLNTPLSPLLKQSIPNRELPSWTCRLFTSVRVSIGDRPLFSARARGTASSAAENARIAYCSIVGIYEMKYDRLKKKKGRRRFTHLIRCLGDCDRAADLRCTPAVYDPVVDYKVAHDANRVMQGALRLVYDLAGPAVSVCVHGEPRERRLPSCCFPARRWSRRGCSRTLR